MIVGKIQHRDNRLTLLPAGGNGRRYQVEEGELQGLLAAYVPFETVVGSERP